MDNARRTEMLAEMGLRVLIEAYGDHPRPASIGVAHALGLADVDETYFTDPTELQTKLTGEKAAIAPQLIQCMIIDGVLREHQVATDIFFVTVSPLMRAALRHRLIDGRLMHQRIGDELDAAFHSDKMDLSTFTALAREIGFEP